MTDSQLIRDVKDGNVDGYAELVRRYERKIFVYILHMLKNCNIESMAEDLCQETFYKAYKNLHSFRDVEASFSTWLYTIARNTVFSELRKSRNSEVYIEDNKKAQNTSDHILPEHEVLRSEREVLVRKAIEMLPENQRSALILREYEQMDYKEIAAILDSTVSAVKSLLFRARNSIRSQLKGYIVDSPMDGADGMDK